MLRFWGRAARPANFPFMTRQPAFVDGDAFGNGMPTYQWVLVNARVERASGAGIGQLRGSRQAEEVDRER